MEKRSAVVLQIGKLADDKHDVGSSRLDNRLFQAVGIGRVVGQVCPVVIGGGYYASIREYDGGRIERVFDSCDQIAMAGKSSNCVVYAIAVPPPPGEKIRMGNFSPPAAGALDQECDGKASDAISGQLGPKRLESERAAALDLSCSTSGR